MLICIQNTHTFKYIYILIPNHTHTHAQTHTHIHIHTHTHSDRLSHVLIYVRQNDTLLSPAYSVHCLE